MLGIGARKEIYRTYALVIQYAIAKLEELVEIDNVAVVSHRLKSIKTLSKPSTGDYHLDIYTILELLNVVEQTVIELNTTTRRTK